MEHSHIEFQERKKIPTSLDIAPLIDIVFLLIIFFMLTANFVMHPGIKIKLPSAVTAKSEKNDSMIVYISSDNRIYLNDEEVEIAVLEKRLTHGITRTPGMSVILKADAKVDLGLAVRVMDVSRKAGAGNIVISTEAEKPAK